MIPINQTRTTIFDSGTTLKGFCIKACIPALPGFWKWSLTVFLLRIFEIERLHKDGEILHQEDAAQDRDQ